MTSITSLDQMEVPTYWKAVRDIFFMGWRLNHEHLSGNVFTLPFKLLLVILKEIFFVAVRLLFMLTFPISAFLVLHENKKEYARAKDFFENPSKYW